MVGIGGLLIKIHVNAEDAYINETIPDIYIKASNPGYTIDGKSNGGEMIEIPRKNSDEMMSLADITISYTNASGEQTLVEFSEYSYMVGETLLLRLATQPLWHVQMSCKIDK